MKHEVLQAFLLVFLFLGIAGYLWFAGEDYSKPVTSKTGLVIQDEVAGNGAEAAPGKKISVHYAGMFTDGKVFDASRNKGDVPFTFILGKGEVIPGWDEGLIGMRVGGKRKLIIPPSLAYGNAQVGIIPPNSTLIFEIDLFKVE